MEDPLQLAHFVRDRIETAELHSADDLLAQFPSETRLDVITPSGVETTTLGAIVAGGRPEWGETWVAANCIIRVAVASTGENRFHVVRLDGGPETGC